MKSLISKIQLSAFCIFKILKIPEITSTVKYTFLPKQVLTDSVQSSCSNHLFRKPPGKPTNVLKKESTVDVTPQCLKLQYEYCEHCYHPSNTDLEIK